MCKIHFIRSIEERVKRVLSGRVKWGMNLGLAVSGGKDSLTMAYILWKLSKKYPATKLTAIIIDEGIRGYRDKSIEYAVKLLEELSIDYVIASFNNYFGFELDEIIEKGEIDIPCTFCGAYRRRLIELMGRKLNVDLILTGHNANDVSETFLLNVIQGNYKHIVYRIDAKDMLIPRLYPLKMVPEVEVVLYAYLNDIDYFDEPCPYTRYALRNEVRTFLNKIEREHPGTLFNIIRLGERLKTREKLVMGRCELCGYPTTRKVCKVCELNAIILKISTSNNKFERTN